MAPRTLRPILRVHGYREFVRACDRAQPETREAVHTALKNVAEPVRREAAERFATFSERSAASHARSAAGFRTAVSTKQISVRQSIRKTTGLHPEYGALQMRKALLPARAANIDRTRREMERALDVVIAHFNH